MKIDRGSHFSPLFDVFKVLADLNTSLGLEKNADDRKDEKNNCSSFWLLILARSLLHLPLVQASLSRCIVSCTRHLLHLLHLSHFQVYPTTHIIKECDQPKNIMLTPTIPVQKNSGGHYLFVKFFLPPGLWIMDKKTVSYN